MLTSAPEPGSPLAIRLLGPFHAEVEGKPLPRLRSRKGEWLLALLVLRGDRPQRRDWLAETLWPENRPEDALASLRQSVKDLRAALGDQSWRLGPPGGRTLQLDLAGAWVDLLAFDECVHKGDPDSQARAARLYAGPVLEGCSESWVLAEREQREQAYLHALEWLARDAEARGDRRAAAGYLRRAAAVSPQSGALLRALMVTLAEAGELHAAVEAYQEHRRHLYVDWNAEPEPETTALFRRLRAGDYTRLPTAEQTPVLAHAVPGSLSPLLGRERELMEVEGKLLTGRLVTLTGPGGVGKTRLALAAAAEAGRHFAGGAAFIELAAVRHPTQLPTAISAGLGLEPTAATTGELIGALSGRQLLLVLDNCEHVLAASAQAAHALVSGCPGLRILATSRERLG
ncbi:MAG: transcriptional regulator, winged helix family, partial [Armatimonadetes bacterium]|nr:transcriptional regulator, winged helix family [Armatimonadota bacterium]